MSYRLRLISGAPGLGTTLSKEEPRSLSVEPLVSGADLSGPARNFRLMPCFDSSEKQRLPQEKSWSSVFDSIWAARRGKILPGIEAVAIPGARRFGLKEGAARSSTPNQALARFRLSRNFDDEAHHAGEGRDPRA